MLRDLVCAGAAPILRVQVPFDDAHAQLIGKINHVVVNGAVRRAQAPGIHVAQDGAGVAHFGIEKLLRDAGEVGVVVAVVAECIASVIDLLEEFGVVDRLSANDEEGGLRVVVGQQVDHLLSPRLVGTIIEGQEDGGGAAVNGRGDGHLAARRCVNIHGQQRAAAKGQNEGKREERRAQDRKKGKVGMQEPILFVRFECREQGASA